jgi:glycosyltransferase involved in cell wall biosynthesis
MTFCLRLLREFKPDVIQAYFAVPAGAIAYSLWRLSGVPYCVYMGGSDVPGANRTRFRVLYPFLRPIVRRIWASSRLNTVASRGLLDLCLQTDPGRAFRLIPNGVELGIFRDSYETRARTLRSEPRAVRILTVGRLVPRKGFQHLIGSLPEVERRAKRPFVVQIVGSGDYEAFLRRTCNELGVEHLVQFVGQVSYEELVWYYSGADVFALVSLSEGMACALLEALASGLPAVVTNVEGNDDLVAPGRNGYLIDVGDLESLADGLVALVNDADLRQRMGRESIAVVQEYDWRHIAAQYDRAYRDIVAGLSVSKARR